MRYTLFAVAPFFVASGFLVVLGRVNAPPANPPLNPDLFIQATTPVPPRIYDILSRACYDCHSSETRWPWYASVPVVSSLIRGDVSRGRAVLNFSEWTNGAGRTPGLGAAMLAAGCATVEQHLMPKSPYPYLHPGARLSPDDITAFCSWTRERAAQVGADARRATAGVAQR